MKWYKTGPKIIKPVITRVKRRVQYDPFHPGDPVVIEDVFGYSNCHSINPRTGESTYLTMWFREVDGELYPHPMTSGPYRNCTAMPAGERFNMKILRSALPGSDAYLPQWTVLFNETKYVLGINFKAAVELAERLYMSQFKVEEKQ